MAWGVWVLTLAVTDWLSLDSVALRRAGSPIASGW